ncbi:MAG: purine-binding chemotaxis protein CheW [Clostridia bacterium]|nr:purine-binding chemotaxis protein CheW [Clostridia bacterium]NCC68410.1 purine-binding chemotaxis protein CheW [Clostridia bacterium]
MADYSDAISELEEDTQTGRFLTFTLGEETYGIEIRCVTEIVGIQAITEMPEMPDYIKGIINLRGLIIPLLDVRLRFGKEPRPYDDRTCVIVIDLNGVSVGLIVDSVSEVLTIPEEDVSELPALNSGAKKGYVKNIGKLENCVVLLLDCGKLLEAEELEGFSEL